MLGDDPIAVYDNENDPLQFNNLANGDADTNASSSARETFMHLDRALRALDADTPWSDLEDDPQ